MSSTKETDAATAPRNTPPGANAPHPHLAFMYGTLKTTEPNHHQLFAKSPGGSQFVGKARTVEKYPLIVTTPFNIPFLLLKEGTGHQIRGELYRVDDKTLAHLDWFEGHPNWYLRVRCHVTMMDENTTDQGPETVECWIYGLPRFKKSLLDLPIREVYLDAQEPEKFKPYNPDTDESLNPYLLDD